MSDRTTCPLCHWSARGVVAQAITCPQCGNSIGAYQRGLGDLIQSILDRLGGRLYKRIYRWAFNHPCGCQSRQAALNTLGERLHAKALSLWRHRER